MNFDNFTASPYFILNFKKKYRIVSRKVTKIVTKKQKENEGIITRAAKDFINDSKSHFTNYDLDNVWNTDQSGFCYEYYSQHTLDYCGIKMLFKSFWLLVDKLFFGTQRPCFLLTTFLYKLFISSTA